MKRYLPMLVTVGVLLAGLWFFWPQVVKARERRQDDLNDILDGNGQLPKTEPPPPADPPKTPTPPSPRTEGRRTADSTEA